MRQMKNSGIEWVGDIPDNWDISKIKYISDFSPKCSKFVSLRADDEITYTPMEYIKNGYYIQNLKRLSEIPASLTAYEEGDIVIAKVTPCFENGNIARMDDLSCGVGAGSSELFVLRAKKCNRNYLFYLLQNYIFMDYAISTMTGTGGLKRVSSDFFKNSEQPVPPIDEQERIAEFLDKKCGEIDGLIADIKTQAQTLEQYKRSVITEAVTKGLNPSAEMKDSGIQWIGNVPAGWTINKIDSVYSLRNEKVSDKDYMPLSVTMKGIVPQLESAAKTNDGDNRKLVRKGDFAINSRSDRRGSCGISELDGSVSLINLVLKPRGEMNNRYYNWLFHTEKFADEFYKWGHGIVDDLWTTRWIDMRKISVPMPPLSEQKEIADYLDNKCAQIEELISAKQSQIETLESYKKSLIYEYVTGKKEVA